MSEQWPAGLQKSGTVSFVCAHPLAGWLTDSAEYKFGPFGDKSTLDVVVLKKADRTMEVMIAFEHFGHTFIGPAPSTMPPGGLPIAISWDGKKITLAVDGQTVSSATFAPVSH